MRLISIQSGELRVVPRHIYPGHSLDSLTSFATRRNPKRAFLFTSKLTGKHVPARPSTLLAAYADLANCVKLSHSCIYVIGMAETAIALAQGVFEALLSQGFHGGFLHSTRYSLRAPTLLEFEEQHCHASRHLLYPPSNPLPLEAAKSLVIIDDEISTGNTLVNILAEFRHFCSRVEEIVLASLTSFISHGRKQEIAAMFPGAALRFASLFEGDFTFTPHPAWRSEAMPAAIGNGLNKDHLFSGNYGRTGVDEALRVKAAFPLPDSGRVLVLGTGEFLWLPLLLARQIEAAGADCFFQSTTRSPVLLGDSIHHVYSFADNYGDEIENFVYNVGCTHYDHIFVCYETSNFAAHSLPFAHKKVWFKDGEAFLV